MIDTSIELIEEIGMDKFSMPKVARALGVQTSSLYHYFADRNALMTEVARKDHAGGTDAADASRRRLGGMVR
ncbi:helix-turn-helix domain-containing protein [Gordonia humi]|uniref:helix-turn-helix domain-containing protein n=1 Tax=Gordonia humi TaxID=686429 RepID=UPI00362204AD